MSYIFRLLFLVLIFVYQVVTTPFPLPAQPSKQRDYGRFEGLKGIKDLKPCGLNTLGQLTGLYVTGCDAAPCLLGRHGKTSVFFEGIFDREHDSLTATVTAKVGSIKYPFLSAEACDHIVFGGKCPMQPGRKYLFRLDFDLSKYDHMKVIVDLSIIVGVRDEKTQDQICGELPAKLVTSS